MSKRITIDPVTRIEGHLRIDVEVDGGKVVQGLVERHHVARHRDHPAGARPARGLDLHPAHLRRLHHRPRDRLGARVENALGLEIPLNAQLIRNLIISAHALHDHIVHFYQLSALDWVDVVSALKADPAKAAAIAQSLSDWPGNSRPGAQGRPGEAQGLRGQRAARHLHQRLLGPPGHEAPARGEPARGGPLPPGPRLPAQGPAGGGHPGLQDAQHPEPGGGRRGQRHQPGHRLHRST